MTFIPVAALPLLAGIAIGYTIRPESKQPAPAAYAVDPAYEYMVGSSAWQMSAEAHALMMQGFRIASENIEHMAALADAGQHGYYWEEENGQKNGEWMNKDFTDFIQSEACTPLPGAVPFANHCVKNGVALFYVTNRYDQAYKLSEEGYAG